MPLVSRLSSLGFVYADGGKSESLKTEDGNGKPQQVLSEEQQERMVIKKPSFLEIISYTSFPAANMCGPFFEFKDYINFIEQKDRYTTIPASFKHTLLKLLQGFFFIGLCIILPNIVGIDEIAEKQFSDQSYLIQFLKFTLVCFSIRTTYYAAWALTDGSIGISGLSYNGKNADGTPKFDRIICAHPLTVETCTTPRDGISSWNTQTVEWLRHYVYNRLVTKKFDKTSATMMTNLTSAFWHGFYPVYYEFFFFLAILSEIGKDVYKLKDHFSFIPSPVSTVLCHLLILFSLNYAAAGMIVLDLDKAWNLYKRYYFFWHFVLIFGFIAFRFVLTPMFKKKSKKTKKE
jgi:lysophospholipid acyltransferase